MSNQKVINFPGKQLTEDQIQKIAEIIGREIVLKTDRRDIYEIISERVGIPVSPELKDVIDDIYIEAIEEEKAAKSNSIKLHNTAADLAVLKKTNLFINREDEKEIHVVNLETGEWEDYSLKNVRDVLGAEWKKYREDRVHLAKVTYNPRVAKITYKDEKGRDELNIYRPPKWLKAKFLNEEEEINRSEMPEIYKEFLEHFVGGNKESFEYLVDWIAHSLRAKNHQYLVCTGAEKGLGKGVLAETLRLLHGSKNFIKTDDRVFKERFNSQLKNKTMVYVDEVNLEKDGEIDRLKDLVNETLTLEAKGVDSEEVKNYANVYITSNRIKSLKIEDKGERRYSFIHLGRTKLVNNKKLLTKYDCKTVEDFVGKLHDSYTVQELAESLWHRRIKNDMFRPFGAEHMDELIDLQLTEWEEYIVDHYDTQNICEINAKDVQALIKQAYLDGNLTIKSVGKDKIKELWDKKPELFTDVRTTNRNYTCITNPSRFTPGEEEEVNDVPF